MIQFKWQYINASVVKTYNERSFLNEKKDKLRNKYNKILIQ